MNLDHLTDDELRTLILKKQIEYIKLCQDNFLLFVRAMWPDFICRSTKDPENWGHHQIIANEFQDIATKKSKRLIVNMPPRHTKIRVCFFSISCLDDW